MKGPAWTGMCLACEDCGSIVKQLSEPLQNSEILEAWTEHFEAVHPTEPPPTHPLHALILDCDSRECDALRTGGLDPEQGWKNTFRCESCRCLCYEQTASRNVCPSCAAGIGLIATMR